MDRHTRPHEASSYTCAIRCRFCKQVIKENHKEQSRTIGGGRVFNRRRLEKRVAEIYLLSYSTWGGILNYDTHLFLLFSLVFHSVFVMLFWLLFNVY